MGGKSGSGSSLPADHPFVASPITQWFTDTGLYPSNSLQWWTFKRPLVLGDTQTPPRDYTEVFDSALRFQTADGNTPAPKGHYILYAFDQDRSDVSDITGLDIVRSNNAYPQVCAFFAGRVFYAGTIPYGYSTKIYFSQIIERLDQVGQCYQVEDPTSEDTPDLLPSDGGIIVIPEIAQVVYMFPKADSLYVFATNGIWQITGSAGVGFKANDYSVSKITDTPALSAHSFVSVDGNPIWWNRTGIWTLANNQLGIAGVQSLTDQTIKSWYADIPADSKAFAKGAYNSQTKIVQWVYNSQEPEDVYSSFVYDSVLNLNVLSGAFYPWYFSDSDTETVRGIFALQGTASTIDLETVGVDGTVVVADTDEVVAAGYDFISVDSVFKYTVAHDG